MKYATLATLAFTLITATGCHPHCKWGDDPKAFRTHAAKHIDQVLAKAGASADVRAKVSPILDRVSPEVFAVAKEHNALHAELMAEWASPSPDRAKLDARIDTFTDAMRKAGHEGVSALIDLASLLSPDEKRAFIEHMMSEMD